MSAGSGTRTGRRKRKQKKEQKRKRQSEGKRGVDRSVHRRHKSTNQHTEDIDEAGRRMTSKPKAAPRTRAAGTRGHKDSEKNSSRASSASAPGPRARQRTEVRRPQIILSAMRILASEGPRKLTASRLGQDVGISAGAIFRHFATMEAIIDAVLERMEGLLFEDFEVDHSDPVRRLEDFFIRRVTCFAKHPEVARLLLSDQFAAGGPSRHAERLRDFKRRTQAFILGALSEAQAAGRLRPNTRIEDAALLIVGGVLAFAYQAQGHRQAPPPARTRAQTRTPAVQELLQTEQTDAVARRLFRTMHEGLFSKEKQPR